MARHDEQTNVRLPIELKDWLKEQATQAHRSVTAQLIVILEQRRQAQEAEHGKATA